MSVQEFLEIYIISSFQVEHFIYHIEAQAGLSNLSGHDIGYYRLSTFPHGVKTQLLMISAHIEYCSSPTQKLKWQDTMCLYQ